MNPLPGLFDERNPQLHSAIRRKVSAAYSMSSLVQSEAFVDDCTSLFQQRLSEFAQSGELVDLTHWFQCYAFDVIGNITVSECASLASRKCIANLLCKVWESIWIS